MGSGPEFQLPDWTLRHRRAGARNFNGRFRTWLDQVLNRLATQITVVCVESPSSHAFELQLSRKLSLEKSVGYINVILNPPPPYT